jgi:hypothetical protein
MKTNQNDKAPAKPRFNISKFNPTMIDDSEGYCAAECRNQDIAKELLVAVNEHAALNAVAEAADNYRISKEAYRARESSSGLRDVMNNCEDILFEKSANLDALRKGQS